MYYHNKNRIDYLWFLWITQRRLQIADVKRKVLRQDTIIIKCRFKPALDTKANGTVDEINGTK